jgi:hypothetical protein
MDTPASPDPPLADELMPLLERIAGAVDAIAEGIAAIEAKLDAANETLRDLNRSQWGPN